jgi:hypothetical protein
MPIEPPEYITGGLNFIAMDGQPSEEARPTLVDCSVVESVVSDDDYENDERETRNWIENLDPQDPEVLAFNERNQYTPRKGEPG